VTTNPPTEKAPAGGPWWRDLATPLNALLVFLPVAAWLRFGGGEGLWLFLAAVLAIVPLAGLMGKATENLAEHLGPTAGGLLNATFGNAAELIIALAALRRGPAMYPLVKASITGSIIGNLLLVFGLAAVVGGLRRPRQMFDRTHAGVGTTLLAIACVGLVVPTLYFHLFSGPAGLGAGGARALQNLSEEIAVVLIAAYGLGLVFTLRTHAQPDADETEVGPPTTTGEPERRPWSTPVALAVLLVATVFVAVASEWLVGAVEAASHALGLNEVFVGVIVVAAVGNAAEHSTAVWMAWKNRMELAVQIAVGSSTQVALFVAPVLVFASLAFGHAQSLDLHFTLLEVVALLASVWVISLVCHDGETHWMEGAMLLAVYLIFALAFYNLPAEVAH
jgi:Ca2+:H+ antiporter